MSATLCDCLQVVTRRAVAAPADVAAEPASSKQVPVDVLDELLLTKYAEKYERMGIPERMPGRQRYLTMLANRPPPPPPEPEADGEDGDGENPEAAEEQPAA